jgi:hypothetical protein
MQLVEKHMIKQTDPRFAASDRAAFASKNLYNAALYEIRQHFIVTGKLDFIHWARQKRKGRVFYSQIAC